MGIKRNFFFNSILTVAGYIFPILVFPYVSRVLGVNNIGICNFVDGIINYYILFATLGVSSVGIREIAKYDYDTEKMSTIFSTLLFISAISTIIVSLVLIITIYTIPQFYPYKEMLWIGLIKLIFNLFLIEWFFQGIQNFKYITIRAIAIRGLYVLAVFTFVKESSDYKTYYLLTSLTIVLNSIFNILYSKKFVRFSFKKVQIRKYLKSFFVFGFSKILISFYTSFNIIFLGFISNDVQVGYYTTSTKIYTIIIGLFTALTAVIIPRMSSLIAKQKYKEVNLLTNKTTDILLIFSLPIIIFSELYATEIINIIAGPGYEGAIIPFQIVMPLVLIIGLEQIYNQQLLMCLNDNKGIFFTTLIGAIFGLSLNLILVKHFLSIGSAFSWLFSEIITLICAVYFVSRKIQIAVPYKTIRRSVILATPYVVIGLGVNYLITNVWISISLSIAIMFGYFLILNTIINKNEIIMQMIGKMKTKLTSL